MHFRFQRYSLQELFIKLLRAGAEHIIALQKDTLNMATLKVENYTKGGSAYYILSSRLDESNFYIFNFYIIFLYNGYQFFFVVNNRIKALKY